MEKSIKQILKSAKGETIMESLASLLIFAILILAVTTMIASSLKMTKYAAKQYNYLQTHVNATVNTPDSMGVSEVINFIYTDGSKTFSADQKIETKTLPSESSESSDPDEKAMRIFSFVPGPAS